MCPVLGGMVGFWWDRVPNLCFWPDRFTHGWKEPHPVNPKTRSPGILASLSGRTGQGTWTDRTGQGTWSS
jgi:hypothetical protein